MKIIEKIVKVWPVYNNLARGDRNAEIPKSLVKNYAFSSLVCFVIWMIYISIVIPINFPGKERAAFTFYTIVPTAINGFLVLLFYILHLIGQKYSAKGVCYKQWYIMCGSLISTLICFFPALFFHSVESSVILLILPFIMSTFFTDESWLVWSSAFTIVSGVVLSLGVIDFGEWKITQTNTFVEVMVTLLSMVFVFFVIAAMFFLKTVQAVRATEADQRNKAQTAFFINMSHEIRTPINAILGFNEMIGRDTDDPAIKNYSNDIKSAGDSLLTLVNNVLDFSKIESGKMEIVEEEYDLSELIKSSYLAVQTKASEKGLKLTVNNDPKLPKKLRGDMGRIRQVVLNLLTNAIKYTRFGSVTLTVSMKEKEDELIDLIFEVRDTGAGIAKKDIDKLFVQFERIDEKKNRNIEGTGLGLPLVKRILSLMNGFVKVDSKEGKGSSFTAVIPQKVCAHDPVGSFEEILAGNVSNEKYSPLFIAPNANILVVDDVKLNISIFYGLIKDTMVHVHAAYSGYEALEKAHEQKYDLIFMDHLMPEMDGIETMKRLRDDGVNKDTPVIILTANAVSELMEEYKDAGFADCLTKPVNGATLEQAIKKYLPKELIE